jgi:lactate dehydrogenase-like 2-hydroxyacid dehydrogenase
MKVFSTRLLPESGLDILREAGIEVLQWEEKRELSQQELISFSKEADALLAAGRIACDAEFLRACSHLKVISLFSVGYDNIDVETATELKIPIGHTPDVLSKATANVAFLLMQAVARKAFYHHKRIAKGDWGFFEPAKDLGIDLSGNTLGIFGLGNIGYEMAKACKGAFDMEIIYHNRHSNHEAEQKLGARKVSFEELLEKSDVISVHSNLSPDTKGKFGAAAFSKMKPSAIFINTARGAIHNEKELLEALQSQNIWGVGLDVTNPEPMKKNNPLLDMPNVAVLPHIGSSTKETRDAMAILAAQNIIAGLNAKKLPKAVNPEVYE